MVGPVWPDLGPFGMRFWPCGPGGGGRRGAGAAFGEVAWPCCEGGGGTRLIPALPPLEDAPTTPEDPLFRGLAGMFFLKDKLETMVFYSLENNVNNIHFIFHIISHKRPWTALLVPIY